MRMPSAVRREVIPVFCLALTPVAIACHHQPSSEGTRTPHANDHHAQPAPDHKPDTPQKPKPTAAEAAFRNAIHTPPEGYDGPHFVLSADYPKDKPECPSPWLKRKVKFDAKKPTWNAAWQGYVKDIVDYVKHGQDPDLPNDPGWKAEVDGETRWYHVPWMAYDGQRGREFVHGLTNELSTAESSFVGRGSGLHRLADKDGKSDDDPLFETWSVGFYNPCGGHSIGQQWPKSGEPETYTEGDRTLARGMPFPEGTVVVKVLNTTATADEVPYLKHSTTWKAHAHEQLGPNKYATCKRTLRDVHLVQMDLAVVDERSPTRWVYSTLIYDGTLKGKTVWDRLRPLGVQWGSDPDTFPAVDQKQSKPLHDSIAAPIKIYEHYGCNKRLAGNVDQANSSCVSCHMGAYAAAPGTVIEQGTNVPAIFSFEGMCSTFDEANAHYFSNYAYPAPFPGSTGAIAQAIPLDSSLQLQVAFAQYAYFKHPPSDPTCPPAE